MLRTLLSMLNDKDYLSEVRETLNGLKQAYANTLSSFEEEGDSYVMVLNVPEGLTSSDVNVEYDDEANTVTVETNYERGSVVYSMKATETLPADADVDTMAATVVNGVFTLVVDKLPEPVEEETPEVAPIDPVVVPIKRKNK
jgi:HSP20 family molecular chaperone IbpA